MASASEPAASESNPLARLRFVPTTVAGAAAVSASQRTHRRGKSAVLGIQAGIARSSCTTANRNLWTRALASEKGSTPARRKHAPRSQGHNWVEHVPLGVHQRLLQGVGIYHRISNLWQARSKGRASRTLAHAPERAGA